MPVLNNGSARRGPDKASRLRVKETHVGLTQVSHFAELQGYQRRDKTYQNRAFSLAKGLHLLVRELSPLTRT